MKTTLLTITLSGALLASASFAQETFFFRMESGAPTRILEIDRNGLLSWSNAVTPTSFCLSGALSLTSTGAWHRVIYGETTNKAPTIQAPVANPLVCLDPFGRGTNVWIGRPLDSWRKLIKSTGNRLGSGSVAKNERHILYTEEILSGMDDYAVRHYDVLANTTTTIFPHAGKAVAFDLRDDNYFYYIASNRTSIFRRALDGSTDTPWITDAGHVIHSFAQLPDGGIMIKSGDAGPPYLDRIATFTSQGVFERLLLETAFDGFNYTCNPIGDRAVVSYRDADCSGQRHVIVYNLNTGAGQELPTIATNYWPASSCAVFIGWAPYDELWAPFTTNLFFSPVDGHVTGNWSVPSGYGVLGIDSNWRWYATDQSLIHILRLNKNP
jgi:hypothetical protein